jgi:2-succinyl-5-enolpyruvyl-6-hydroxy-3-cyclohexene-1-carboxylate synthase
MNAITKFAPRENIHSIIDERSASFFALGLTKATNVPVAVICTSGSAMANMFAAVIEAQKTNNQLIIISADRPSELALFDDNQCFDQKDFFGRYVSESIDLMDPDVNRPLQASMAQIKHGLETMSFHRPGPIHVNIPLRAPLDEQADQKVGEHHWDEVSKILNKKNTDIVKSRPNNCEIESLMSSLTNKKTLLAIGQMQGMHSSNIEQLIKSSQFTTVCDVSCEFKYVAGTAQNNIPSLDHPEVKAELESNPPEVVIHFGKKMVSKHFYQFLRDQKEIEFIHVGSDHQLRNPAWLSVRSIPLGIDEFAAQLLQLGGEARPLLTTSHFDKLTEMKSSLIHDGPLSFPLVSKTMVENLPNGINLCIGNSTIIRSFENYSSLNGSKHFNIFTARGLSGIEGALSSALGVSMSSTCPTVLMVGDVSFIHDLSFLAELKNTKSNLTIFLLNNSGGHIFGLLPLKISEQVRDLMQTPHDLDFGSIVQSFGIAYQLIEDKEQLVDWHKENDLNSNCVQVIEIKLDPKMDQAIYEQLKTVRL